MRLPNPRDKLVGCVWLPRHIAKIRHHLAEGLPLSYRVALGSRIGVDGYFFKHFHLSLEQTISAVKRHQTDAAIGTWFADRPEGSPESIERWNKFAETLGAPGHEGRVTVLIVRWFLYPKSIGKAVGSIFDLIIQDEDIA